MKRILKQGNIIPDLHVEICTGKIRASRFGNSRSRCGRARIAQRSTGALHFVVRISPQKEKSRNSENCFCFFGPSVEIRTRGLLNPIQARYQTSPHPDLAAQATVICYHSQHKKSSPNFMKLPKISTPNQFCAVIVEECCKSSVFSP